jgi:quercetin dioxygenase-like cupin family protein
MFAKGMVALVLVASVAGLAFAEEAKEAKAKGKKEAVLWSADEIKWVDAGPPEHVKGAALWGDMNKGAYGVMTKFAAGADHPMHTHSADLKSVVLSGTWWVQMEGGEKKKLGPGSYMMIPGHAKHASGCAEGAECVIFMEQMAKFDMKPVVEKGEKAGEKPAAKPVAEKAEKAAPKAAEKPAEKPAAKPAEKK